MVDRYRVDKKDDLIRCETSNLELQKNILLSGMLLDIFYVSHLHTHEMLYIFHEPMHTGEKTF